jgi:N-formylglutamate amidohydrolase
MYTQTFRPAAHGAFLPQVRMGGVMTRPVTRPVEPFLGQVRMGETLEGWYKRAQASLERYRFLKAQVQTINNDIGRQVITAWLGNPNAVDTPEYRYAAVLQDFTYDAAPAQEGLDAYSTSRRTNRIEKLESFNDELNEQIEAARVQYGTRVVPGAPSASPQPSTSSNLTVPLLVAGAAVAAAIIFG